jgi:hypothetical protein
MGPDIVNRDAFVITFNFFLIVAAGIHDHGDARNFDEMRVICASIMAYCYAHHA